MADHGSRELGHELREAAGRHPHLREYLQRFKQFTGEFPEYIEEPSSEWEAEKPNVLYNVGGPIFCHIYGDVGKDTKYHTIEPELSGPEQAVFDDVRTRILEKSVQHPAPEAESEYTDRIEELLESTVRIGEAAGGGLLTRLKSAAPDRLTRDSRGQISLDVDVEANLPSGLVSNAKAAAGRPGRILQETVEKSLGMGRIPVSETTYDTIRYRLNRDIVGLGPLEPVMRDPYNEDIHVIGPHQTYVDHGTYGLLPTTVDFGDPAAFDNWLRNIGERMGDPVSDSDPIVDSTLPDGSRINIIYSSDVSLKGPSLTIRQGDEVPLSVGQITKWGTLSPELAAYLWLCLENEQTVFVVGETASGKTTTLNAITAFIPRDSKIYTAEDTAEVLPPHDTWQQLLTREGQGENSADVDMFDLVAAALRSRPDYIIVGEVRGAEGRMAFQAAQTGHPVMLTFHASDIVSMIQRFTGEPINVPETFMDNADVALFQNRVKQGDDVLRRVTSVQEIEGYSKEMGGVVTRQAFYWDPVEDEIVFQGRNNSYVLEEQIATLLGYEDTREIYDEMDFRTEIIERIIQEDLIGYHDFNDVVAAFQRDGVEGLPFTMARRDL
ncbi:flagella-related protein I [Halodesulfurarchaeum formicicum]|uniref:Flagella-related protein I n=1 Tax=Halodesulfurarchaeum formicicum TaxID=1873524 RepID=A0A1D8S5B2_9EURY|nr:type II/IV secretion system ATPase subunit [Halodesulfurarchaeum formicicum]AOW80533.1 flagella-related protein I [Halodesulfurarchaeum formicicum]APE95872.1 flagella-related protein I [Halodesulfurarchaeum formicicum]